MIFEDENVTIFIFDFLKLKTQYKLFKQLLSDNEKERSEKYINVDDRVRFTVGRGITKLLLSLELNCTIKKINILYKKHGKPYIENSNLYFNISHNQQLYVVVISNKEVGIDVEEIKKVENIELLIKRTINERSLNELENLDENELQQRFIEDWVVKESYLKLLGSGINKPIKDINYILSEENESYKKFKHKNSIYTKKIIHKNKYILCYSSYCNK
jgi:4'-phosphopantetheinyl transferase